ncbi:CBS domain-containing protein [Wohlfahrtiimonas chitiniclastica]|uniref:TerC family protein n=1 Tax=Wohlfahrtiimonas chitiniclastica TaxID=400946 RepID=UPI001BD16A4F|nr:transporter associated domain-containing protein [Wohlfahrtiimonas chitiniclastica]MBS7825604.1 CBS domain-containing protein [Wohlfahrtiimonas chitiniclastica]
MEVLLDPSIWVSLIILIVLEIVLGIDNLIFIAILSNKLPPRQRNRARITGLSLALIMRIGLLSVMTWMITLTQPLFTDPFFQHPFSVRDIILVFGGFFLLQKATRELHERIEGGMIVEGKSKGYAKFWPIVLQIIVLDAVFSFDAVITATSIAKHLWVMVAAVSISMGLMLFAAKALTDFVNRHPTIVVLCLSFLLMIGLSLIMEGFGIEVPKGYIYAAIGFSVFIELINQLINRNLLKQESKYSRRERAANLVLKMLGTNDKHEESEAEEEDDNHLDEPEIFGQDERNMVSGVLTLGDRMIRSIMTPRNNISWINIQDSKEEILRQVKEIPHNYFPVCDGHLDEVIGVVRAKDVIADLMTTGEIDRENTIKPAIFSHRSTTVLKMMDIFRHTNAHMVIVTDDFGSVHGVITLLDIIEAIAGEFPDEDEKASIEVIGEDEWIMAGSCDLHLVEQTLSVRGLVDEQDDYSSLGGMLVDIFDNVPAVGDSLELQGYLFMVKEVDDRRILNVHVVKPKLGIL